MSETTCRWAGSEFGWLKREHLATCHSSDCDGCAPCGKTHCAMRGRCANHVVVAAGIITCPGCIGKVRSDLAAVVTLYAIDMPEEATEAGVDSEAFNLAGPAAETEQLAARREYGEADGWRRGWCGWPRNPIETDDQHHPYAVLGRWDVALREQYGPNTELFVTVASAARYLTQMLAGPFPHSDEFAEFAMEVSRCRRHLEAVAHDDRTPERGRPCPRCAEANEDGKGPRLLKRYAKHDITGESDTWHCPAQVEHWWSDKDYRDRVASDYIKHAKALTADQMREAHGIKRGSLSGWASKGEVRKRGKDQTGRQLYDVPDALRMRGATRDDQCA